MRIEWVSSKCGRDFDEYVARTLGSWAPATVPETRTLMNLWQGRHCKICLSDQQGWHQGKVRSMTQSVDRQDTYSKWSLELEILQDDAAEPDLKRRKVVNSAGKAGSEGRTGTTRKEERTKTVMTFLVNRMNIEGGGTLKSDSDESSTELISLEWMQPAQPAPDLYQGVLSYNCPYCRAIEPMVAAHEDPTLERNDECPVCLETCECRVLQCGHDTAISYDSIGITLKHRGQLEAALMYYRKALVILERVAPGSLDIAISYRNIGTALYNQGDLVGALREYHKAVTTQERLAPDSLDVASSYSNLGVVLRHLGCLSEALRYSSKALVIRERLAPDSRALAISIDHTGMVLEDQGNLEEALRYYRKALTMFETLSPGSKDAATSYTRIGSVLFDQGSLEESLTEYRKALLIRQRLEPGSLHAATSHFNVATVLCQQGDLDGALSEYQKALAIEERLAPGSLNVASSYSSIGVVQKEQGKLEDARMQYDKALAIQGRLAPNSLDTACSYGNIGSLFLAQGNSAEALRQFEKAVTIQERLSPNTLTLAAMYKNIGGALLTQSDSEGALRHYQKALVIEERIIPASVTVAATCTIVGRILACQGVFDEALIHFLRAYNIREASSQEAFSESQAELCPEIGILYALQGDWETATGWITASKNKFLELDLASTDPRLLQCTLGIGVMCLLKGDFDEAARKANELIRVAPDYHCMYVLKGKALTGSGDFVGAIESFDQVLSKSPNDRDALAGKAQAVVKQRQSIGHRKDERQYD